MSYDQDKQRSVEDDFTTSFQGHTVREPTQNGTSIADEEFLKVIACLRKCYRKFCVPRSDYSEETRLFIHY